MDALIKASSGVGGGAGAGTPAQAQKRGAPSAAGGSAFGAAAGAFGSAAKKGRGTGAAAFGGPGASASDIGWDASGGWTDSGGWDGADPGGHDSGGRGGRGGRGGKGGGSETQVCQWFLQGRCRFGDECSNLHPTGGGGGGGGSAFGAGGGSVFGGGGGGGGVSKAQDKALERAALAVKLKAAQARLASAAKAAGRGLGASAAARAGGDTAGGAALVPDTGRGAPAGGGRGKSASGGGVFARLGAAGAGGAAAAADEAPAEVGEEGAEVGDGVAAGGDGEEAWGEDEGWREGGEEWEGEEAWGEEAGGEEWPGGSAEEWGEEEEDTEGGGASGAAGIPKGGTPGGGSPAHASLAGAMASAAAATSSPPPASPPHAASPPPGSPSTVPATAASPLGPIPLATPPHDLRRAHLKRPVAGSPLPTGICPATPPPAGICPATPPPGPDTAGLGGPDTAGGGSPAGRPKRARADAGAAIPAGWGKGGPGGEGGRGAAGADPLSRQAAACRAARFDRGCAPVGIPAGGGAALGVLAGGQASSCDVAVRAAGVKFDWYIPPPYSWSALVFPPSRDDGAEGRNHADGGGWGRCTDMCPADEAHERLHIAPNANMQETDPLTGDSDPAWLVTMFHRNDAARVWKPSDIRNVNALANSVEHLLTVVLPRRFPAFPGGPCPPEAAAWQTPGDQSSIGWEGVPGETPFIRTAGFVRDRLRQIRQELTMQQPSFSLAAKEVAVDLLEQCTRFHIMVEHRCCELGLRNLPPDDAKFDSRMNMQMYTQSLSGLQQLYEELRHQGVQCANEAEFQAYYLVSSADPDVLFGRLANLPPTVLTAPSMQIALRVMAAIQGGDFGAFFRELKRASYLTACLMHKHFETVRFRAIVAINRAFAPRPDSRVELPLADLERMLCLEDADEAKAIADFYGLHLSPSGSAVLLTGTSRISAKTDAEGGPIMPPLVCSRSIIEAKRLGIPVCQLMMSPQPPPRLLELAGGAPAVAAATLPSPRAVLRSVAAKQAAANTAGGVPARPFAAIPAVLPPALPPAKGEVPATPAGAAAAARMQASAAAAISGRAALTPCPPALGEIPVGGGIPVGSSGFGGLGGQLPLPSQAAATVQGAASFPATPACPAPPVFMPGLNSLGGAPAAFLPSVPYPAPAIPGLPAGGTGPALQPPAVRAISGTDSFVPAAATAAAPREPTAVFDFGAGATRFTPAFTPAGFGAPPPLLPPAAAASLPPAPPSAAPFFPAGTAAAPPLPSAGAWAPSPATQPWPQPSVEAPAAATPAGGPSPAPPPPAVSLGFGGADTAAAFAFPPSPKAPPPPPVWSLTLGDDEARVDAPLVRSRGRAAREIAVEIEMHISAELCRGVAAEATALHYAAWTDADYGRKQGRHPAWLTDIACGRARGEAGGAPTLVSRPSAGPSEAVSVGGGGAGRGSVGHGAGVDAAACRLAVLKLRYSSWAATAANGRARRSAFGTKRHGQRTGADVRSEGRPASGALVVHAHPAAPAPKSVLPPPPAWGGSATNILQRAAQTVAGPPGGMAARTTGRPPSGARSPRGIAVPPGVVRGDGADAPTHTFLMHSSRDASIAGGAPPRLPPPPVFARRTTLPPPPVSAARPTGIRMLGRWWAPADTAEGAPRWGRSPSLEAGLGMRDFDDDDEFFFGGGGWAGPSVVQGDVRAALAAAADSIAAASAAVTAPLLLAVRAAKAQIEAVAQSLAFSALPDPAPGVAHASAHAPLVGTHRSGTGARAAAAGPVTPTPMRPPRASATAGTAVPTVTIGAAAAAKAVVAGEDGGQVAGGDEGGDTPVARLVAAARAARREREALDDKIRRAQVAVGWPR